MITKNRVEIKTSGIETGRFNSAPGSITQPQDIHMALGNSMDLRLLSISEGINNNRIAVLNKKHYFIKKVVKYPRPTNFIKQINWYLLNTVFKGPIYRHTKFVKHGWENITKEYLTWKLWRHENIPTLEYYAKDKAKGIIVWKFQHNSQSFKNLLSQDGSCYSEFKLLVKTYKDIRECAMLRRNPNLLHSDPILANFLYDQTQSLVIPIDSDIPLNSKMKIDDLNISLLNLFLGSILCLEKHDYIVRAYVRMFVKSLSYSETIGLFNFNNDRSIVNKVYFYLRNYVRNKLKKKPENLFIRSEEFAFSQRYNRFVKQVLLDRLGDFNSVQSRSNKKNLPFYND